MHIITQQLRTMTGVQVLCSMMKKPGVLEIPGCPAVLKSPLAYLSAEEGRQVIVIGASEQGVRALMADYYFYSPQALYYPARDLLFHHANVRGGEIDRMRSGVYQAIDAGARQAVFLPADALIDKLRERESLHEAVLHIRVGDTVDLPGLRRTLTALGYENEYQVEAPGEYAVRGGIIDIYPLSEDGAYRIELFDDEVDQIRIFDPATQRTLGRRSAADVYPLETDETEEAGRNTASFLSYFDPEQTVLFFDDLDGCISRIEEVLQELEESRINREESGDPMKDLSAADWFSEAEIIKAICAFPVISVSSLDNPVRAVTADHTVRIDVQPMDEIRSMQALSAQLQIHRKQKNRILFVSGSRTRARRLSADLTAEGFSSFFTDDHAHAVHPGEVMVTTGRLTGGFYLPEAHLTVITDGASGTQRPARRRHRKVEGAEQIRSFADLHPGDYVVHVNHGIGIYRGIEQVEVQGVIRDYMKLEYAKGAALYIQVDQFDLIQKYTGGSTEGRKPRLSTLGGKEWKKTREKVEASVDEIAQELVELYALRRENQGYVYGPDTVWQKEFEEMFPYEETADQTAAIRAVKQDMESPKIMDRLLCGDVGFGKTEVALRAAFKAVQENKQVVYLVPTTILAQQHYHTFSERMAHFPVRIELMTRFQSSAEIKETIRGLKNGLVDIVIGTHRLLSKDVEYKDLGLLIIDEEQRFGVNHKEKIKQLKYNIDVLSLTATPIPRTLHMSLIGIRDVSLLEEPPQDRRPIETFVMEYDEQTVREAITRELKRGGQVYYVHNLVQNIADAAARVQALVPQAHVGYAHGQMREHELEDVMADFIERRIDVLVSTTIVETGLDIPNVNTMIIQDADRMGLAQLYQLRGRVGRSNRSACCFLMYRKDKVLRETAQKRLSAIREFTALGSGIRIAMRDLQIRGAGNLLGKKQSGNMEAVGYELYSTLLNEAVNRAKGAAPAETFETDLELGVDAYIPDSYISDEVVKLDIYKRIAAIGTHAERLEMEDELTDRFGPMPMVAELLLLTAEVKAAAHAVYLTKIKEKGNVIEMEFYAHAKILPQRLPGFLHGKEEKVTFYPKPLPRLVFRPQAGRRREKLEELLGLLREMEMLTEHGTGK